MFANYVSMGTVVLAVAHSEKLRPAGIVGYLRRGATPVCLSYMTLLTANMHL